MLGWVALLSIWNYHNIDIQLCCCSVAKLCPALWDTMDCSMPGSSVFHYLPKFAQDAYPLSQWCYLIISSSIIPFSSCLQSFPTSGSFPVSQLFVSGGLSIGISASASGLQMNIQDWFPLWLAGWISLQSKGLSRVFFSTIVQNHQFLGTQPSLWLIFIAWFLTCDLTCSILENLYALLHLMPIITLI